MGKQFLNNLPVEYVEGLIELGLTQAEIVKFYRNYRKKNKYTYAVKYFLKHNNTTGLTKAEVHAIWGYTTNLFYSDLNKKLREKTIDISNLKIARLIESGLEKLGTASYNAYRLLKAQNTYDASLLKSYVDKIIDDKEDLILQFLSVADNRDAAVRGHQLSDYAMFVIFYYGNINAYDISALADGIHFRGYSPKELLVYPPVHVKLIGRAVDNSSGFDILVFEQNG